MDDKEITEIIASALCAKNIGVIQDFDHQIKVEAKSSEDAQEALQALERAGYTIVHQDDLNRLYAKSEAIAAKAKALNQELK